jgi:hypothetical protein
MNTAASTTAAATDAPVRVVVRLRPLKVGMTPCFVPVSGREGGLQETDAATGKALAGKPSYQFGAYDFLL